MRKNIFLLLIIHCSLLIVNAQWQPDYLLTPGGGNQDLTSLNNARNVASAGNDVYVVWYSGTAGLYDIMFRRSTDVGITWGNFIQVTTQSDAEVYPSVCLSGPVNPVIHVAWSDGRFAPNWEIYYKRSTNGGITWGAEVRITNDQNVNSQYPSIAASGSIVHLVWDQGGSAVYIRSTDGGVTWQGGTPLSVFPLSPGGLPSISLTGTYIHTVWGENDEINYRRSLNAGVNWEPVTRLTYDSAFSRSPCISVSNQDINVVWYDTRDGNAEIYYKKSRDGGQNWEADKRLTNSPSDASYSPSVFVSGTIIHVVWYEIFYDYRILYKKSLNGGVSWGSDVILTNLSQGTRINPSISAFNTSAHVVWTDTRNGNDDIYYKRNPTANSYVYRYTKNNVNKPITDFQNTFDTINVNINDLPDPFYAEDVNISIDTVFHTNDNDLEFTLIHAGITDTIIYRAGGTGDNFILTELDDSASTPIANGTAPFTGLFKPYKPLSQFNNMDVTGNWILKVYDRASGNTGILNAWSLTLILQTTIGIKPIGNEIPKAFNLSQNYPNPFNPVTTIKFSTPRNPPFGKGGKVRSTGGFVTLKIYDILGREVATLVNEELQPGTYEVDFDGSKFSSGVYYYRIIANDFVETKKMLLIK